MLRSAWKKTEAALRASGYVMEWYPQAFLRPESRFDFHFELAAAHLMLRKKDIFFVEIGANDGVANDPVYPFVKSHGWSGIMIEPLPEVYAKLAANYASHPSVTCINAALAQDDGEATLYTVNMAESSFEKAHQFSSFKKDVLLTQTQWVENIADLVVEIRVPTISWASLVKQIGARTIDVIQIDVEGYDAEILRMIDFRVTRPSIVHYERSNLSKSDQEECAARLANEGYSLAMNGSDVTAYRRMG